MDRPTPWSFSFVESFWNNLWFRIASDRNVQTGSDDVKLSWFSFLDFLSHINFFANGSFCSADKKARACKTVKICILRTYPHWVTPSLPSRWWRAFRWHLVVLHVAHIWRSFATRCALPFSWQRRSHCNIRILLYAFASFISRHSWLSKAPKCKWFPMQPVA